MGGTSRKSDPMRISDSFGLLGGWVCALGRLDRARGTLFEIGTAVEATAELLDAHVAQAHAVAQVHIDDRRSAAPQHRHQP